MSSKIKVSELFYSIQGEGRYMGIPSVFLRTFGCNFTCSGFGMPKGEKSNERNVIADNIAKYKQYKDLPLVNTGCDSYASWDPKFKDLSPLVTTEKLAETIVQLLPYQEWREEHLVITGGEPLLGWQRSFPELLNHPLMKSLKELTFETNGTQLLSNDFEQYLYHWGIEQRGYNALTFSVSPKLSNSGENRLDAIKPEVIVQYEKVGHTYLKFVIATEYDLEECLDTIDVYKKHGFKGNIYLMPVGGVDSVYHLNNKRVAEFAMKSGLRYSDRLQIILFKNAWGT
jgi:organic radical activating enzyme